MVTSLTEAPVEESDDQAAQLASAFRIAVMRLTRRLASARSDDSLGLSRLSALSTVLRHGPLCPTALAELERVQPPSITRVIVALEARGLVTRHPHPSDRRQTIISITDLGRSIVENDRQRRAAWLSLQLDQLTPEERAQLAEVLPILERIGIAD
jgi:DNA-binding MarR family transcriptional regulator